MSSVFIVNGDGAYRRLFEKQGWEVVSEVKDADLIQFTGGADVSPVLYGHDTHPKTRNFPARDALEEAIFKAAKANEKPMAGICRGGQFLNVMSGGQMWQHVDGHATGGKHNAVDCDTGFIFPVTSTHHQMMIQGDKAIKVAIAQESTFREKAIHGRVVRIENENPIDLEALYYPHTKCFCFQPHPEFAGEETLSDRYFYYIYKYLKLKA